VSKLISNPEGELGVVLFDRTKYRATLTDAGRVFFYLKPSNDRLVLGLRVLQIGAAFRIQKRQDAESAR